MGPVERHHLATYRTRATPTLITHRCYEKQQAAEGADGDTGLGLTQRYTGLIRIPGTGRFFLDPEAKSDSTKQAHSDVRPRNQRGVTF